MEFSRNKVFAGLALTSAIGLTAFGIDKDFSPNRVDQLRHNADSNVESSPDGSRIVYLSGSSVAGSSNNISQIRVYEYCDGHNFVQDPLGPRPDFKQGPIVSVNDSVCADGKLNTVDFEADW